jgi:hypothetical protein
MADAASDDDRVVESDGDSDDNLVSTARVLGIIEAQQRQMTKACSMVIGLLEDDDDRMGDTLDGDYSVDALQGVTDFLKNMLSGHESRFFRVVGFTIAEWEVTICQIANELYAK